MNITLTRPFWDPLVNLISNRPEVLLLDGSSRDFASDGSFAVISRSRWRFCSGMRVSCFLLALSFECSSGHWRVLGVTERLAFSGWQRVFPDALIACRSQAALGRNAIRSITYQMDPEREPPLNKLVHWNNFVVVLINQSSMLQDVTHTLRTITDISISFMDDLYTFPTQSVKRDVWEEFSARLPWSFHHPRLLESNTDVWHHHAHDRCLSHKLLHELYHTARAVKVTWT